MLDGMPILSLSADGERLWAAGPGGLAVANGDGTEQIVPQPLRNLACCLALGDRVLVGGTPHGVAFNRRSHDLAMGVADAAQHWQASFMDLVNAPVLCMAASPAGNPGGDTLLVGTEGGGVLRSGNGGEHWQSSNFGLQTLVVLALSWAAPASADAWPRWSTVFACTEEGVYRSPNAGRGWKRADCPGAFYQAVAPALDFPQSKLVLAGTEDAGLFRSNDGGRSFQPVADTPQQVNSIVAMPETLGGGWLLSSADSLWRSADGEAWQSIPDSHGALILQIHGDQVWAGTDQGLSRLDRSAWR